ncbi:MAG TPA: glutathione S-transferase family protein [Solirubrobacteraceae bacterium]|nr:glutathione S-transferase family protein [Solirubrobacteraceae bacterium]
MTLILHEHPFAAFCWKALIALGERDVPFERHLVGDAADRAALAELWPLASIPVLVDDAAGVTLPESTIVIEYLDRFGEAPPLIPADPDAALQARLWDRVVDGHVATPMQKIVADALRPPGREDPEGVTQARAQLDQAYPVLETQLGRAGGWLAGPAFTLADVAAAPALFYALVVHRWDEGAHPALTAYWERLSARPSVARVIEEARPYREVFPLPWPEHVA